MLNNQRGKRYDIFDSQILNFNLEYTILWIVSDFEVGTRDRLANLNASLER
jgi:hypothetical protein